MTFDIGGRYFKFFQEQRQWDKLRFYYLYFLMHKSAGAGALLIILALLVAGIGLKCDGKAQKACRLVSFLAYILAVVLLFLVFPNHNGYGKIPFSLNYYLVENGFHESQILFSLLQFLIFIPLGCLLAPLLRRRWYLAFPFLYLGAVLIEELQYILKVGYQSQCDILVYFVGASIGLLIGRKLIQLR